MLLHASAWCSIVVARRSAHCAAAGWQRRPAPCTLACLQGYQVPGAACCCTHWYCRQELVPACSKCHPHQGDLCHTTDESSPLSTTCHFFSLPRAHCLQSTSGDCDVNPQGWAVRFNSGVQGRAELPPFPSLYLLAGGVVPGACCFVQQASVCAPTVQTRHGAMLSLGSAGIV